MFELNWPSTARTLSDLVWECARTSTIRLRGCCVSTSGNRSSERRDLLIPQRIRASCQGERSHEALHLRDTDRISMTTASSRVGLSGSGRNYCAGGTDKSRCKVLQRPEQPALLHFCLNACLTRRMVDVTSVLHSSPCVTPRFSSMSGPRIPSPSFSFLARATSALYRISQHNPGRHIASRCCFAVCGVASGNPRHSRRPTG